MKKTLRHIIIGALMLVLQTVHAQSYEHYVGEAARSNPEVLAAYSSFEQALTKSAQVRSLPDPTLEFGYFISPIQTRTGPQVAKFSLMQMFPWFGSLREQAKTEDLMAEAEYQLFLQKLNSTSIEVSKAYFRLLELKQAERIHKDYIALIEDYMELSKGYLETGGKLSDLIRVQMELNNSLVDLDNLALELAHAQITLNRLCGLANDHLTEEPMDERSQEDIDELPIDTVLSSHPEVHRFEILSEALEAKQLATRAAQKPMIGVGVDYMIVGTDAASGINGQDAVMPMVSVSLPIHRKSKRAALREIELAQEEVGLRRNAKLDQLQIVASQSLTAILVNEREMKNIDEQVALIDRVIELENNAYANGTSTIEEVLSLEKERLNLRLKRNTLVKQRMLAVADWNYVTNPTLTYTSSHE